MTEHVTPDSTDGQPPKRRAKRRRSPDQLVEPRGGHALIQKLLSENPSMTPTELHRACRLAGYALAFPSVRAYWTAIVHARQNVFKASSAFIQTPDAHALLPIPVYRPAADIEPPEPPTPPPEALHPWQEAVRALWALGDDDQRAAFRAWDMQQRVWR